MDQALNMNIPIPEFQLKKTPVAKPPQPLSKKSSESLKCNPFSENMVSLANENRIDSNSSSTLPTGTIRLDARQHQRIEAVASVLYKIAMP